MACKSGSHSFLAQLPALGHGAATVFDGPGSPPPPRPRPIQQPFLSRPNLIPVRHTHSTASNRPSNNLGEEEMRVLTLNFCEARSQLTFAPVCARCSALANRSDGRLYLYAARLEIIYAARLETRDVRYGVDSYSTQRYTARSARPESTMASSLVTRSHGTLARQGSACETARAEKHWVSALLLLTGARDSRSTYSRCTRSTLAA